MAKTIVLADDSITIQKIVNLTFSGEGIDVVAVSNGDAALKKVREIHPDLVLADIFMPGENGYELCEHIKANPELRHIPVILLVGAYEPFDQNEAARVMADGHLTKPFEIKVLINAVRSLISQTEEAAAEPPPANEVPPPAEEEEVEGTGEKPVPLVPPPVEEVPVELPAEPIPAVMEEVPAETPGAAPVEEPLPVGEKAPAGKAEPEIAGQFAHVAAPPGREPEETAIPAIDEGDVLGISSMVMTPAESTLTPPAMVIDIWGQQPPAEVAVLEEPLEMETPEIVSGPAPVHLAPAVVPAEPPVEIKVPEVPPVPVPGPLPVAEVPPPVMPAPPGDGKPPAPAVSLDQEALVEQIVQKVIEKLSRDAIERIAWEVVPDLAELMIKERVEVHMKSIKN